MAGNGITVSVSVLSYFPRSNERKRGTTAVNEMNAGETRPKTPVHLWIIGVVALLWNAMGAFDYLVTQLQSDFYMGQFTEEQLAYFYGFPVWVTSCWAIAVWSAVAGSIGLLLRKKWSVWAFAVALAGMALTSIYNFGMSNGAEIMGSGAVIFSIIIWIISILLLVYVWAMAKRGVLV